MRLRTAAAALLAAAGLAAPPSAAADSTEKATDVLRVALPAAAFALTVRRDDVAGRRQLFRAFGANVLATWALKEAFDKRRPDGTGDDAFPSGHASMAFQGAAFMHRRYGIRPAWPAYTAAAFAAWGRVEADEHDAADVLAGAALGVASSFLFAKRRDVTVTAYGNEEGGAVGLTWLLR